MISYIAPQLHAVRELPVVPTCIAFVICLTLMYLVGHLEGWRDCEAQSETWASRRQARNQYVNIRRSAVLPFAQRDAGRRRLRIRLVQQPRVDSGIVRLRAAGRGIRLNGRGR